MRHLTLTAFFAAALMAPKAFAADAYTPFPADLPLLDMPFNAESDSWPSMQQSVRLSKSAYQFAHFGLGHVVDPHAECWKGFWGTAAFFGVDSILTYLPPFNAWVHEEFHRSVMGVRGISSYNGVYDIPLGAGTIAVSRVRDEDLVRLKAEHPADMVRLPAAGIEGESQLILTLERDAFYSNVGNYHQMLYLSGYLNSYFYVSSGPTEESNTMTDEMNEQEPSESERDFVGHDFTSWVYDLHRPDEPYEVRGAHPSGTGLNRYRKRQDLTDGERSYLALQGRLQLLNFVDPQLFGRTYFQIGDDTRINGSLQHYLTPFGYAVNSNLFLKTGGQDFFGMLTFYRNQSLAMPGLTLEWLRAPLPLPEMAALPRRASWRAQVWKQPKNLRYDDDTERAGALLATTLYWALWAGSKAYLEVEGKTEGWVPGSPYLDRNVSTRLGLETWIY